MLWRHEALLEELMQERDLLPVRFGTLVADEHDAARAVAERSEELLAGLERVRGAVELALRVNPTEAEPPGEAGTGRDYLRAKVARLEIARALHEPLAAIARDSDVQPGRELLRAAYLVDRDAVDDFVAAVRRPPAGPPAARAALHRPLAAVLVRGAEGSAVRATRCSPPRSTSIRSPATSSASATRSAGA